MDKSVVDRMRAGSCDAGDGLKLLELLCAGHCVEDLPKLLDSTQVDVIAEVLFAMSEAQIGFHDLRSRVISLLEYGHADVRWKAAILLSEQCSWDAEVVARIVSMARDEDERARWQACMLVTRASSCALFAAARRSEAGIVGDFLFEVLGDGLPRNGIDDLWHVASSDPDWRAGLACAFASRFWRRPAEFEEIARVSPSNLARRLAAFFAKGFADRRGDHRSSNR